MSLLRSFLSMIVNTLYQTEKGRYLMKRLCRFYADRDPTREAGFHISLITCRERMGAYYQAIKETIRPGDVVLDVGCGTGILGFLAIKFGASKVIGVDMSEAILKIARELAKDNGMEDKVEFIQADVREVKKGDIPPIDVLIFDSVGRIGTFADYYLAWHMKKFLKPSGRVIPRRAELYIVPTEERWGKWLPREIYGFDFSRLFSLRPRGRMDNIEADPQKILGKAPPVITVNLGRDMSLPLKGKVRGKVIRSGTAHGLIYYSKTYIGGRTIDSTPGGKWFQFYMSLDEEMELVKGQDIELSLEIRDANQYDWDIRILK